LSYIVTSNSEVAPCREVGESGAPVLLLIFHSERLWMCGMEEGERKRRERV
jgi:hypothetical protein